MAFIAILIACFLGKVFRGCLKYLVLAALFIWLSRSDPVLANKIWELAEELGRGFREFMMGL
jgi:hypothetical protein